MFDVAVGVVSAVVAYVVCLVVCMLPESEQLCLPVLSMCRHTHDVHACGS